MSLILIVLSIAIVLAFANIFRSSSPIAIDQGNISGQQIQQHRVIERNSGRIIDIAIIACICIAIINIIIG